MEEVQPAVAMPSVPAPAALAVGQSSGLVKFGKDSFAGTVGELSAVFSRLKMQVEFFKRWQLLHSCSRRRVAWATPCSLWPI